MCVEQRNFTLFNTKHKKKMSLGPTSKATGEIITEYLTTVSIQKLHSVSERGYMITEACHKCPIACIEHISIA